MYCVVVVVYCCCCVVHALLASEVTKSRLAVLAETRSISPLTTISCMLNDYTFCFVFVKLFVTLTLLL